MLIYKVHQKTLKIMFLDKNIPYINDANKIDSMKFEDLKLKQELIKAVKKKGFVEPTEIQKKCIPEVLAGKDVVGQSFTGSGKTAAFGLPMLDKIHSGKGTQALILTPTRELACQIRDMLIEFSAFMKVHITAVYGGVGIEPQIIALRRADIVVATPGRMLDHMNRNTIDLSHVSVLVIDEADRMFDMGFIDDVEEIIRHLPQKRQTLLFSATMPDYVHHLIRRHLRNPHIIKEQEHVAKHLLKQIYFDVGQEEKFSLLVHLLKHKTPGLAIVFCGTKREVDIIEQNLRNQHINSMAVHGGLSQDRRSRAVDSLKSKDIQVLVATDVAARGLDISNISHIYNYDSPKTSDEYTNRIGRTARAGKYGEAVTLLTHKDHNNFRNVISDRNIDIEKEHLPVFEKVHFTQSQERRFPRSRFGHQRRFSHGRR